MNRQEEEKPFYVFLAAAVMLAGSQNPGAIAVREPDRVRIQSAISQAETLYEMIFPKEPPTR